MKFKKLSYMIDNDMVLKILLKSIKFVLLN